MADMSVSLHLGRQVGRDEGVHQNGKNKGGAAEEVKSFDGAITGQFDYYTSAARRQSPH
jgi:hypothetical protein